MSRGSPNMCHLAGKTVLWVAWIVSTNPKGSAGEGLELASVRVDPFGSGAVLWHLIFVWAVNYESLWHA